MRALSLTAITYKHEERLTLAADNSHADTAVDLLFSLDCAGFAALQRTGPKHCVLHLGTPVKTNVSNSVISCCGCSRIAEVLISLP